MDVNISKFNEQLKNFVDDLKSLNIENINKIEDNLYYLKFNSRIAINLFGKCILENDIYRYMIFQENEQFFLCQDYSNGIEDITQIMIKQIKGKWIELNKDQKQKIWNYFKIFIYYSDEYININTLECNKKVKSKYLSALL